MSLTTQQVDDLKIEVACYLGQDILKDVSEIVVPQSAIDWGFCFHPEYCDEVTEVEVYNSVGVTVLFVNASYEVVAEEFAEFTVENDAFLSY